ILERRLTRRGLGLAAVLPTLVLTRDSASAVSLGLQSAAVDSALAFAGRSAGRAVRPEVAALAEGMLKPALGGKLALAAAVLLAVVACGFGAGLIASSPDGTRPERGAEQTPPVAR